MNEGTVGGSRHFGLDIVALMPILRTFFPALKETCLQLGAFTTGWHRWTLGWGNLVQAPQAL